MKFRKAAAGPHTFSQKATFFLHFGQRRGKVSVYSLFGVIVLSILRKILVGKPKTEASIRRSLPAFFLITGSIIFWELLMHFMLFPETSWRVLYVVLFSLFFGLLFTMLTGFFKRRGNAAVLWICMGLLYLWYAAQLIYYKIFGGFISVHLIKMGGEAVANFFKETMSCIGENLWLLAILAIPLAVTGFLLHKKLLNMERRSWGCAARQAVVCVLLHLVCLGCLYLGGTNAYSAYDAYHNVNTGTDASVSNLGFLTTFRLELKFMILGADQNTSGPGDLIIMPPPDVNPTPGATEPPAPEASTGPTQGTDPTEPTEPVIQVYDQVMEIDFDALIGQAQDKGDSALATLHQYFSAQSPTQTNDFTGLFAGKNLIYMVCESFSPEVISQEMTPTLYKLYNEGIRFNNFYGTYRNVTTNGEYSACLGLFPDMSRSKSDGSFKASADNYLPFALGNIFQSQLGITSHGYHNYVGSYYARRETHPNMGYTCKFMNSGMQFSYSWPSSDFEMMKQSVADYVNEEQFHAYYMTFSGHYQYNFETNPMCIINQDAVKDLECSQAVKAYIACHLELEKAMAYLMEQLELAGQLEDTVIVMTTDHFPYGLTEKQYSELAGETKDGAFGIYENAFICWAYGMEDPVEVDTPCCTVDILPTLLNLFGFEYDSRLLIGQDVLDPNAQHMAILHNGSFVTDKVMFNSANGKVTYLVDEAAVPENYVDTIIQIVQNKFTVSTEILNRDYYRIVFSPEEAGQRR